MKLPKTHTSDLVRHSRAGDAFHYRWAARRCLRMINPHCAVNSITIEASHDTNLAGECSIDLAEYSESSNGECGVHYIQLKHSTRRLRTNVGFHDLKETLAGFAARYVAHIATDSADIQMPAPMFSFVTNRSVAPGLCAAFDLIREGKSSDKRTLRQIEKATTLSNKKLRDFITRLHIVDGEGDYVVQHELLQGELAQYLAGFVDSTEADLIVNLVSERALPHRQRNRRKGEILREDVLAKVGVTSPQYLFPAPPELETLANPIRREQHGDLLKAIMEANVPLLIHAAGGVGKSVVARQIAESLPQGSFGIVYDCFGSGRYRNPSEPRHRASDALVQIGNELAAAGFCRSLIGRPQDSSDVYFRGFLDRLRETVQSLREITPNAVLVILVDAADNAKMAAEEYGQECFISGLLREKLPEGCRLVALCRTERRHLLEPPSTILQLPLEEFSETETAAHLRKMFPQARVADVREFHRLTGANPRVQANALNSCFKTIDELLASLGPETATVDTQISSQLLSAVGRIQDRNTADFRSQIDAICLGLANLPPFVPVAVLARVAQVEEATIHSFVSDLGRPLWHSDSSIMFRDEPTETWFRQQFAATPEQIKHFALLLEPLTADFPYAAKALPSLLLSAGDHSRLIEVALSDHHLPETSPIDAHHIRVYRLQFAFRAALKVGRIADAARLALRAGEEMAGNKRQMRLLQENIDIAAQLLDPIRVQELAYRRLMSGGWQGSENVYSASLLSHVEDFKGESRGYLRAARKWLSVYFEERSKHKENDVFHERLQDSDLVEMAWTHFNLSGVEELVEFLLRWRPAEVIFRLTGTVTQRLIDAGRFDEINELTWRGRKNAHLVLAVANELETVARFPQKRSLKITLNTLSRKGVQVDSGFSQRYIPVYAILSFCEACAAGGLPSTKILSVLDHYTEAYASSSVGDNFNEGARKTYLRGAALRAVLRGIEQPEPKSLLPPENPDQKTRNHSYDDNSSLIQAIRIMLPWHYLRAQFIAGDPKAINSNTEKMSKETEAVLQSRYQSYDPLPYEVSDLRFDVLALNPNATEEDVAAFARQIQRQDKEYFRLRGRLSALRTAFRTNHLAGLRSILEDSCRATIEPSSSSESPDERAGLYITMAQAVFVLSRSEASAYFELAVDAVSKFGDEVVSRWQATVALAKQAAEGGECSDQLTYRFFKCAEAVGESAGQEKYWSRNETIRVGVHLNLHSTLATISRWRDREVGWFDEQILVLASETAKSGKLAPLPCWSLSGFIGCNANAGFVATCIQREPTQTNQQHILDAAIRDFELSAAKTDEWLSLQTAVSEFGLDQRQLTRAIEDRAQASILQNSHTSTAPHIRASTLKYEDWEPIFSGVDILTPEGIVTAESSSRSDQFPTKFDDFWTQLIKRVPEGREAEFLEALASVEPISYYSWGVVLPLLRNKWLSKPSVKSVWPKLLTAVGKRWATIFSDPDYLRYSFERSSLTEPDFDLIRKGVVQGLADSMELVDASTFFGFAASVAVELTSKECSDLLEFSLSRFELHIDSEFGDGGWAPWLITPSTTSEAFAGVIWSALGSPLSHTRWQAVHCVRRLVETNCRKEVDSLFQWLERDSVDAFGSHRFPFYRLHARQYLLIAFERVAHDNPTFFQQYAAVFEKIALSGMPHILIQRAAARMACAIEKSHPNSYSEESYHLLQNVGVSQLPAKEITGYEKAERSPWHMRGEINGDLDIHFGIDFDSYWFKYLGGVFGLPETQTIELGKEAAFQYLGITGERATRIDPRNTLWNARSYYERGTEHSHGSYPRNDDFWFYYSYHSLMSTAARLVTAMPVVKRKDGFEDDPWGDWLRRHWLTRRDGRWLFDRRDPTPLLCREWIKSSESQHWRWELTADDFLDVLVHQCPRPQWLCVTGNWTECVYDRIERISISSAFVSPESADALADSLRSCEDPWDYRLPAYEDDEWEFHEAPFQLIGWIDRESVGDPRLDNFDPYAREIGYPPYRLGEKFATILSLDADDENRTWSRKPEGKPVFLSEIWSEKTSTERNATYRCGERICGAMEELIALCVASQKELLFSVEIDRRFERSRSSSSEPFEFVPRSHKIFILSLNGELRDACKSYRVGQ